LGDWEYQNHVLGGIVMRLKVQTQWVWLAVEQWLIRIVWAPRWALMLMCAGAFVVGLIVGW